MADFQLSTGCRDAIKKNLGDAAAAELLNLLRQMSERIDQLQQTKIDVMPIAPAAANLSTAAKPRRAA